MIYICAPRAPIRCHAVSTLRARRCRLAQHDINKGRWTQDKHKIFMQEYEKYGNNCMQLARVLSTRTPAQIKKHAECFFKQNLKTNSAAVK